MCERVSVCARFVAGSLVVILIVGIDSPVCCLSMFFVCFPFTVWWVRISVRFVYMVVIHSASPTVGLSPSLPFDILHSSVQGPGGPALVSLV